MRSAYRSVSRIVAAVALAGAMSRPGNAQTDSLLKELALFAEDQAATDSFSGVVLVARCEEPVLSMALGFADQSRHLPNRLDTRFRIASMTKMFTAVAVAQLVQKGKFRFQDIIAPYFPDLPNRLQRITVHQLLTHTSGLGTMWKPEFFRNGAARYRTPADFFPLLVEDPLQFEPGSQWAYSNASYVLLGALVERLGGQPYAGYIRERVFRRAGIPTTPDDEISRPVPNRAIAYTRTRSAAGRQGSWTSAEHLGLVGMMPAGGAVVSAPDLLRFATALLERRLLNRSYTDIVLTGKIPYREGAAYAYGFANEMVSGQRVVFHDGGAQGISANLDIFAATGYIAIVLSNYDHPAVRPLRDKIRSLLTRPSIGPVGSCRLAR